MGRSGAKVLAVGPQLVFSSCIWLVVLAVLPPPWGMVGAGVLVVTTVLLAAGVGERQVLRVLCRVRAIGAGEREDLAAVITVLCTVGLGPPVVSLAVDPRRWEYTAVGFGRRHVVISGSLIEGVRTGVVSTREAAAVIAHAAALVRRRWHLSDAAILIWGLPWTLAAGVWAGVAAVLGGLPFVATAWRLRVVVFAVAAVQLAGDGHHLAAVLIVALGAISYGNRTWARQWERRLLTAGDQLILQAGLADGLARFLSRGPRTPQTVARLRVLDPKRPPLAVVPRR